MEGTSRLEGVISAFGLDDDLRGGRMPNRPGTGLIAPQGRGPLLRYSRDLGVDQFRFSRVGRGIGRRSASVDSAGDRDGADDQQWRPEH